MSGVQRTSLQLFRDCLRLVRHVAPGYSAKGLALRATVRSQFELGRHQTDPHAIEALKANAIRALSNYMLYENGVKDASIKKAMDKYHDTAVLKAKEHANASDDTTTASGMHMHMHVTSRDHQSDDKIANV